MLPEHKCICDKNSTEVFEYDNILRRPICEKGSRQFSAKCPLRYVNATTFSSLRKSVRIFRGVRNENCSCNEKNNENYRGEYCIKSELLKDLKNHQYYKNLPLTQTLNLNNELKFIIFFCKVLHQRNSCNYLANLCVLTHYDLDKNGPCHPFYKQQNQQNGISIDDSSTEGSEFDGGEKMKPFLFFKNQKSTKTLLEKTVDFSFGLNNVSHIVETLKFQAILIFSNISSSYAGKQHH
jgi:Meckelin (Transmembrane protein 67)